MKHTNTKLLLLKVIHSNHEFRRGGEGESVLQPDQKIVF